MQLCPNDGIHGRKKANEFHEVPFINVLSAHAIGVLFRKHFYVLMSSVLLPHFLFYQTQGIWSYIEVLDPLELSDKYGLFVFFYVQPFN